MIRASVSLRAWGGTFSPQEAERRSGVLFSEKQERGDIGGRGRFRGQPLPYGNAALRGPTEEMDLSLPDAEYFRAATALARVCEVSGAEIVVLHMTVAYKDQCNLEMSPAFVAALAGVGVPFTMSCYEDKTWP